MVSRRQIVQSHRQRIALNSDALARELSQDPRNVQNRHRSKANAEAHAGRCKVNALAQRSSSPSANCEAFKTRQRMRTRARSREESEESELAGRERTKHRAANGPAKMAAERDAPQISVHENLLDDALSLERRDAESGRHRARAGLVRSQLRTEGEQQADCEDENFALKAVDDAELALDERASNRDGPSAQLCRNFDPYSIYGEEDEEEDVWYSDERLFEDHIQEIVEKWHSIDDEIWAKIICMERNRRTAKAYARKHTISINGSTDDYLDGTTLGLNSFENPDRDSKTAYIKQYIGEGIKIKIHQNGDIFVKRLSRSNVFIHKLKQGQAHGGRRQASGLAKLLKSSHSSSDVYALNSSEGGGFGEFYGVVKPKKTRNGPDGRLRSSHLSVSNSASVNMLAGGGGSSSGVSSSQSPAPKGSEKQAGQSSKANTPLQLDKVVRLFNMQKFKQALEFESRKAVPNRARLQNMCISIVSFVTSDSKMLNMPSWIMIINIVAIDLMTSGIGFMEPYDLLSPISAIGSEGFNKAFDCINFNTGDVEAEEERYPYRKFNGLSSKSNLPALKTTSEKIYRKPFQISSFCQKVVDEEEFYDSKSKSNLNFHDDNCNELERRRESRNSSSKSKTATADTVPQLYGDSEECKARKFNLVTSGRIGVDQQLNGSSSSGFNSHSSYQNDDSSSSSSNIVLASIENQAHACCLQSCQQKMKRALGSQLKQIVPLFKDKTNSSSQAFHKACKHALVCPNSIAGLAIEPRSHGKIVPPTPTRGKRVPKLPHGITVHNRKHEAENQPKTNHDSNSNRENDSTDSERVVMSGPIPIPAPPTSAGGPTGKANLILVSPTGLSPPIVAKKANLGKGAQGLKAHSFTCKLARCEDGQCDRSAIMKSSADKKAFKLPSGIPPHAQLAPPAARRHILSYLMSSSTSTAAVNKVALPLLSPPTRRRIQRPLPGLPLSSSHMRGSPPLPPVYFHSCAQVRPQMRPPQPDDKGLYYRGQQARSTQAHTKTKDLFLAKFLQTQTPMTVQEHHIQPSTSSSAIKSIISNFKQNAFLRQQLQPALLSANQAREQPAQEPQLYFQTNIGGNHKLDRYFHMGERSDEHKVKLNRELLHLNEQYEIRGGAESIKRVDEINTESTESGPLVVRSIGCNQDNGRKSLFSHVGSLLRRSKSRESAVVG